MSTEKRVPTSIFITEKNKERLSELGPKAMSKIEDWFVEEVEAGNIVRVYETLTKREYVEKRVMVYKSVHKKFHDIAVNAGIKVSTLTDIMISLFFDYLKTLKEES